MSIEPKTRPDAILKNLPEERQAQIIEWMEVPPKKTYAWIKKQLAADGVVISENALSKFRSWYLLQRQFKRMEQATQTIVELRAKEQQGLTPQQLFNYGQQVFGTLAIEMQDPEAWSYIQKLNLGQEALKLDRQKFQRDTCELFLKWFADKEAKAIANSTASNSDKIEALGKKMFGEDWE